MTKIDDVMEKPESGPRASPKRRARRRGTLAEWVRAVGQERAEFKEGSRPDEEPKTVVRTNLEQLARIMWSKALEKQENVDIRSLVDRLEGRPAITAPAKVDEEGGMAISADEMAQLLALGMAKVEAWRRVQDGEAADGAQAQVEPGAPGQPGMAENKPRNG